MQGLLRDRIAKFSLLHCEGGVVRGQKDPGATPGKGMVGVKGRPRCCTEKGTWWECGEAWTLNQGGERVVQPKGFVLGRQDRWASPTDWIWGQEVERMSANSHSSLGGAAGNWSGLGQERSREVAVCSWHG